MAHAPNRLTIDQGHRVLSADTGCAPADPWVVRQLVEIPTGEPGEKPTDIDSI